MLYNLTSPPQKNESKKVTEVILMRLLILSRTFTEEAADQKSSYECSSSPGIESLPPSPTTYDPVEELLDGSD